MNFWIKRDRHYLLVVLFLVFLSIPSEFIIAIAARIIFRKIITDFKSNISCAKKEVINARKTFITSFPCLLAN